MPIKRRPMKWAYPLFFDAKRECVCDYCGVSISNLERIREALMLAYRGETQCALNARMADDGQYMHFLSAYNRYGGWSWSVEYRYGDLIVKVHPFHWGTLDHKIPVSRGGSDDLENLCVACRSCNSKKGTMTDIEFRERLRITESVT